VSAGRQGDRQALTARQVFEKFLRIPERGSRRLVPLVFHAEQARLINAFDARDPVTGAWVYDECALLWMKKSGKSETCAGLVLTELIGNVVEPDREVIVIASTLDQSKDVTFASCCRFVRRHQWLAKHIRILRTELVYRETVVDHVTGGRHVEEHIVRAVPAQDAKSLHGSRASLTVFDEFHAQQNYDVVEALARAPSRTQPRIVYSSYAGLRVDAHEGNPLWDVWQRAQRGDDQRLFASFIAGPDGWKQVPWITQKFIDGQRRQFAAVPSKFARLWENVWSANDVGAFLTAEEIRDAIDAHLPSVALAPAPDACIGVDIGLTHDTTAIVASRLDPVTGNLVVLHVEILRGSRQRPVSFYDLEERIVSLEQVLKPKQKQIAMDRWQSAQLAERLTHRGMWVTPVTCDAAWLDRAASNLKRWFAARSIKIPRHAGLIEQLETLEGEELRRKDRVRFTATGANHDDAAVALVLSATPFAGTAKRPEFGTIGVPKMAEISGCLLEADGAYVGMQCPVILGPSPLPGCNRCPAYTSAKTAHQAYLAQGREWLPLPVFVGKYMEPCRWVIQRRFTELRDRYGI
jgi:hypothetical protein